MTYHAFRGDRDFYDLTADELQEVAEILNEFFAKVSDAIVDRGDEDDPLVHNERIRKPYILARYHDAWVDIELLRLKILDRKTKAQEDATERALRVEDNKYEY